MSEEKCLCINKDELKVVHELITGEMNKRDPICDASYYLAKGSVVSLDRLLGKVLHCMIDERGGE